MEIWAQVAEMLPPSSLSDSQWSNSEGYPIGPHEVEPEWASCKAGEAGCSPRVLFPLEES